MAILATATNGPAVPEISNYTNNKDTIFDTQTTITTFNTHSTSNFIAGPLKVKDLNANQVEVIGWCLWVVIVIALFGNFFSFYAVLDRPNFKVRQIDVSSTVLDFLFHSSIVCLQFNLKFTELYFNMRFHKLICMMWLQKMMASDNPYLLSNVLCVVLTLVDLSQIVLVGIPAAISFCTASTDSQNKLGKSFYNQLVSEF